MVKFNRYLGIPLTCILLYLGKIYFLGLKDKNKKLWQDEPYFSRRQELQHRCKNFQTDNRVDLQRMTYDDKHKVVMCVVPKVRNI